MPETGGKPLDATPLTALLPPSISGDDRMMAWAAARDAAFLPSALGVPGLLLLPRLAELPREILDCLVQEVHAEGVRTDSGRPVKEAWVRESLERHAYYGTPWAVRTTAADLEAGRADYMGRRRFRPGRTRLPGRLLYRDERRVFLADVIIPLDDYLQCGVPREDIQAAVDAVGAQGVRRRTCLRGFRLGLGILGQDYLT